MPIDVHAHYVPNRILATLEERARISAVAGQDAAELRAAFRLWVENPAVLFQADRAGRRSGSTAWRPRASPARSSRCGRTSSPTASPSPIASRWHRLMNECLAQFCRKHPQRFALFASVPLPDAAAAAREAEFAMQAARAPPASIIASNVEGVNLGELRPRRILGRRVALDAPIFIHPVQAMPAPRTAKVRARLRSRNTPSTPRSASAR